jgi:hypothetical protein
MIGLGPGLGLSRRLLSADEQLVLPYWTRAYDLVAGASCSRATSAIHPLSGETFGVNEVVKRAVRMGNLGMVQQAAIFDGYTAINSANIADDWTKGGAGAAEVTVTKISESEHKIEIATVSGSCTLDLGLSGLASATHHLSAMMKITAGSLTAESRFGVTNAVKSVWRFSARLDTAGIASSYGWIDTSGSVAAADDNLRVFIGNNQTCTLYIKFAQFTQTTNRRPFVPGTGGSRTKAADDVTVTRAFGDGETIISVATLYNHAMAATETAYPRHWQAGADLLVNAAPSGPTWLPTLSGVQQTTGVIAQNANIRKALGCTWKHAVSTEAKTYFDEVLKDTDITTALVNYTSMRLGDYDGTGSRALNGCLSALHWTDDVLPLPVIAAFMRIIKGGITGLEEVPVA